MGPNRIFIIDTHTLAALNYAKPRNTEDVALVKARTNQDLTLGWGFGEAQVGALVERVVSFGER